MDKTEELKRVLFVNPLDTTDFYFQTLPKFGREIIDYLVGKEMTIKKAKSVTRKIKKSKMGNGKIFFDLKNFCVTLKIKGERDMDFVWILIRFNFI